MASKNKRILYLIVIFLAFFTYFLSYNAKATTQRCALCQCSYCSTEPEKIKIYTAAKNLCTIVVCKKCAHADDEKNNDNAHSATDDENKHDSTHEAMEVACDTHHTDPLHKKKILIIKTQIERILANILHCDDIVSHFKDAPDGLICHGLTVQLITLAHLRLFRLTFCDSFYNKPTDPDIIEATATPPHTQRLMFNSADNITIYNEKFSSEKNMKTFSESNINPLY